MVKYYFNPKNGDLVVFDSTEKDIFILEPIKNVRVVTIADVQVGDLGAKREEAVATPGVEKKKRKKHIRRTYRRLPEEVKTEIIRLHAEGRQTKQIAAALDISAGSVWRTIVSYKEKQNGDSGRNTNNKSEEGRDRSLPASIFEVPPQDI